MLPRKHSPTHWLGHSSSQNWISETVVAFVLGRLASKQVEIAFVGCKCQRKHAFQVLGLFVVNASRKHFPTHWLGHSPSHNWIAETVVAFVLGHLPSKQVEIAFVRWRCQREQASQLLGSFVVNASKETFPNTLARSLSFVEWDSGDHGCVCSGVPGFKTSRNCICGLQMPTKARVPGFGLVCGQCFEETFPNTLARSLSFAQLDCGDCGCVCFGAPAFQTSRNCICALEMPTRASVSAFGLLCGKCFKETFPNTLARSLSFAELDCGDYGCDCFGAPAFQTSRNCICEV
jgi:hypothetical protein